MIARDFLLPEERADMIHEYGDSNYSIFLDEHTYALFGFIELEDEALWARSAQTEISWKWWAYMADIIETNADNSPVSQDLTPMFNLP